MVVAEATGDASEAGDAVTVTAGSHSYYCCMYREAFAQDYQQPNKHYCNIEPCLERRTHSFCGRMPREKAEFSKQSRKHLIKKKQKIKNESTKKVKKKYFRKLQTHPGEDEAADVVAENTEADEADGNRGDYRDEVANLGQDGLANQYTKKIRIHSSTVVVQRGKVCRCFYEYRQTTRENIIYSKCSRVRDHPFLFYYLTTYRYYICTKAKHAGRNKRTSG